MVALLWPCNTFKEVCMTKLLDIIQLDIFGETVGVCHVTTVLSVIHVWFHFQHVQIKSALVLHIHNVTVSYYIRENPCALYNIIKDRWYIFYHFTADNSDDDNHIGNIPINIL